jgi:hypothetical protein
LDGSYWVVSMLTRTVAASDGRGVCIADSVALGGGTKKPLARAASDQRPHPRFCPSATGSIPRRHPTVTVVVQSDSEAGRRWPDSDAPREVTTSLGVDPTASETRDMTVEGASE